MDFGVCNSYLEVDLRIVGENYRSLRGLFLPRTEVIPVLKGDAFGLGAVPVAERLLEIAAPPYLGVADVSEGVALRHAGISCPILLLAGVIPAHCGAVVEYGLTPGVGRLGLVPLLAQEAQRQKKHIRIHLALDTGLGRLGVRPGAELDALLREIGSAGEFLSVAGVYSHFADSETPQDPLNQTQYERYLASLRQISSFGIAPGMRHLSNSAASEWFEKAKLDAVRLGRRMFFDSPAHPNGSVREPASWRTFVTHLRTVTRGERFGYGEGIVLDHDAVIALIGVGYGDGLQRMYVNAHAPVLIHGRRAPLLGLCMDQAFVDVTGIDCAVGDTVTLFGRDEAGNFLSSQETAALVSDEGCGLTATLLPRVRRVYLTGR